MFNPLKYRSPFIISLVLHAIILSILILSFEWRATNFVIENSNKDSHIVNAIMINDAKIQMPNPSPIASPAVVKPKKIISPRSPTKSLAKIIKVKSQPPMLEVKKKVIAIPDHAKKQKKIEKDLIQKQLLTEIKKQTVQKTKHKDLEKAFAKELRVQAAKSLQQELLSEKNRIASAQAEKMRGIIDKYKALILQAIAEHWLVPNGVNKSLSSQLLIRVAAGGTVLDVQVVKSSGDEVLDRSARSAVFKSSPLPVPKTADEFEPFRQFILKVKPENVLARDGGLG